MEIGESVCNMYAAHLFCHYGFDRHLVQEINDYKLCVETFVIILKV